jgi:hypothetical protein
MKDKSRSKSPMEKMKKESEVKITNEKLKKRKDDQNQQCRR